MHKCLSSLVALSAAGLTACAAQSPTVSIEKPAVTSATVKPGAAVSLTPSVPKQMSVEGYNTIGLSFSESYSEGPLDIKIAPGEGLSIFGGLSQRDFDMSRGDVHEMSIDVSAPTDGVYFLNVFAEAGGQARTFSVTFNVGEVTEAMKKAAIPENGEMKDGVRVMQAEETIK